MRLTLGALLVASVWGRVYPKMWAAHWVRSRPQLPGFIFNTDKWKALCEEPLA